MTTAETKTSTITTYETAVGPEPVHFQVECLQCSDSLFARTDTLAEAIVIAQQHLAMDDTKHRLPTTEEVLASPILKWAVTGATPFNLILNLHKQGLVDASKLDRSESREIKKRAYENMLAAIAA